MRKVTTKSRFPFYVLLFSTSCNGKRNWSFKSRFLSFRLSDPGPEKQEIADSFRLESSHNPRIGWAGLSMSVSTQPQRYVCLQ